MDALAIQKAIRKTISRYVLNERALTVAASEGDVQLSITSSRRFVLGDKIALIDLTTGDAEILEICVIPDTQTIEVDTGLLADYPITDEGTVVRKVLGLESGLEAFIQSIYLGDPEVISHYPAITIDIKSRDSEWFTLESTKERYNIDISIYVEAADYEAQYEAMHRWSNAIEQALFRQMYPLIEPFNSTTLAQAVEPDDILIQVTDDETFRCTGNWVWFESVDHLRFSRLTAYLGNGVYRLGRPVGQSFAVGDLVITPKRWVFNMVPPTTQYGTVNKGTMLKAAVINVQLDEEVWRHNTPFIDSISH